MNGVFIAVADRCTDERGVSWTGGSLVASPEGYPLAGPVCADQPAVLAADCDLPIARDKRISTRTSAISCIGAADSTTPSSPTSAR